jgi:hypothetical protein
LPAPVVEMMAESVARHLGSQGPAQRAAIFSVIAGLVRDLQRGILQMALLATSDVEANGNERYWHLFEAVYGSSGDSPPSPLDERTLRKEIDEFVPCFLRRLRVGRVVKLRLQA